MRYILCEPPHAEGGGEGTFRKSPWSMANGNCLEAGGGSGVVAVRDTADRGGVVLTFPAGAWTSFLAWITGAAL